jgi:hypothetical protein
MGAYYSSSKLYIKFCGKNRAKSHILSLNHISQKLIFKTLLTIPTILSKTQLSSVPYYEGTKILEGSFYIHNTIQKMRISGNILYLG